eukprot:TRINITY_DN4189_c0_g1_i5.p3 TRINITY_DN4189_c0_g1~~TRINITY_DN4189_c0_g1_i5.p3  ORF type:complete len:140 (-),score=20.36 TRINITY_DN4189_c0_g1_i5:349-768(-)
MPKASEFTKKGTGTMGSQYIPKNESHFKYEDTQRKPAIPKRDEAPIMGLKSHKNYIVANAVENILSTAKAIPKEPSYLNKKDFGKVPEYLKRIKDSINREYETIREMHLQEEGYRDQDKFAKIDPYALQRNFIQVHAPT